MSIINYDDQAFRQQFPAFLNNIAYPQASLAQNFSTASIYISNRSGGCYCGGMNDKQKTEALYLMTAHLTAITAMIAAGSTPGVVTSATIDKVSVTIEPPPSANQWQYWLQTTPYGQQLLALLQVLSVGGFYSGGRAELSAFRRPW